MKKLIAIFTTLVLICFLSISIVACKDGDQEKDALIGKWSNGDSSYEFNKDGTGIYRYNTSSQKEFEWGFVKNSKYEMIFADVYYIDFGKGVFADFNIETESDTGVEYINPSAPYGHEGKFYKIN